MCWSFESVQGGTWWWLAGPRFKIMPDVKKKRSRYFLTKLRTNLVKHPPWLCSWKNKSLPTSQICWGCQCLQKEVVSGHSPETCCVSFCCCWVRERRVICSLRPCNTHPIFTEHFSSQFQSQNENCLENHRFFFSPAKEKILSLPFYLGIKLIKITNFLSSLPRKATKAIVKIYNLTVKWKWLETNHLGIEKNRRVPFQEHCQ